MTEISPAELHALLGGDDPPLILDVRERWETQLCAMPGALLIPLQSLPQRLGEIPTDRMIAVICHHGMRSAMAADFLSQEGVTAVNVSGGIDEWAREVDTGMDRY
jgi:rhodanese-related sulfurtransferase